jgi:hypothetical protein
LRFGLNSIGFKSGRGLCLDPGFIYPGTNSGYQAVQLAYQLGAARIVLLGFDMTTERGSHWHGDHENGLANAVGSERWAHDFSQLAIDLEQQGVEVINASRHTALKCFKRSTVDKIWN